MLLAGSAAILYAILVWWFSTGVVLWLSRLPRFTRPWSLSCATLVMIASLYGLGAASEDTSLMGTYQAFTCAILIWGWQETGFLFGLVTGPRRKPLSPGARGRRRLVEATAVVLYHELALLAGGIVVFAVCWGGANWTGAWTYFVLWIMRLSAELNLFLGVPNRSEQLLPERLRYLATYFADRPINLLFPISVTGGSVAAMLLAQGIVDGGATAEVATGLILVTSLLALAVIEHWLLVLPLPVEKLWRWSLTPQPLAEAVPNPASRARSRPELAVLIGDQAIPCLRRES